MSHGLSIDAKERVRQAIDIVEYIGQHITLRRAGRNLVGLCPWHDDRHPSLQVNPERQTFKCWVCDIGGDVFTFAMRWENVDFAEALRSLAARAGITLEPHGSSRPEGSGSDKRLLRQAVAWAEEQYHQFLLRDPGAEAARRYLAERGITRESWERFRIGFAPEEWDFLLRRAAGTSFTPAVLEQVNLVSPRSSGAGYYDRFRHRLMFSIRDAMARPVGFGGRVLPGSQDQAKYINTAETPLFSKSRLLYGFDLAREAMVRSRTAVVVEGYTDVVLAHQCGVRNVVAVLGTALTEQHLKQLQLVEKVVLVLDGDEAGQRRSAEILELFVRSQFDLRILTLPDRLDPCDFLRSHGGETFTARLDEAVDALEYKMQAETAGVDPRRDTHRAHQALERILGTLAQAPRLGAGTKLDFRLKEEHILQRLSHRFGIDEAALRSRLGDLRRSAQRRTAKGPLPPSEPAAKITLPRWQQEVLELVLRMPEALERLAQEAPPDAAEQGPFVEIFDRCCRIAAAGQRVDIGRLLLEFPDPAMQSLLVELDERGQEKAPDDATQRRWLEDLIQHRQRQRYLQQARQQVQLQRDAGDTPENLELFLDTLRNSPARPRSA